MVSRLDALRRRGVEEERVPSDKPLYLRGFQPNRNRGVGVAFGAVFVAAIVVANWLVFFRGAESAEPTLDQRLAKPVETVETPLPVEVASGPVPAPEARMVEGTLTRGETAGQALARLGVAPASGSAALAALAQHVEMRSLKAGQKLVLSVLPDGRVKSLTFPVTETSYVEVAATEAGFSAERRDIPTQKETVRFACMIRGSLFESLQRCGEDQSLAPALAELLGGQIDFFTDGRRGDILRVIVEKESLAGRFLRYGKVSGLLYEGRVVTASVFPLESGDRLTYYTAEGEAVDRPFLRSPLKYSRLSSDYSLRRMHPILHTYRPHRAQDYAAPKGTPVYAVGDGKVAFRGKQGASGNLVVVDHGGGWQTYYAHLSGFAKGYQSGDGIGKRTLIGYVGTTGRSTGPHLHFAVAKGGVFVHPRKMLSLPGARLPSDREPEFKASVGRVTGELKALPVRGVDGTKS
jgi:murein DD-endopeptidase MepM/ murein hydrolase activator NlpD